MLHNNNNLASLYQELILEHSRHPQNLGELESPPALQRVGANPLCGDKLVVYVLLEDGHITDLRYKGEGCTIFMSACSLLSSFLHGKTIVEAKQDVADFITLITLSEQGTQLSEHRIEQLDKLAVFEDIQNYPARVKCAALFARTVQSVLEHPDQDITVTSE